jgi:hypothetical protein
LMIALNVFWDVAKKGNSKRMNIIFFILKLNRIVLKWQTDNCVAIA